MSVTSKVRYTAKPVSGGPAIFDNTIAVTGTARFSEALLGVERLRKANEASISANITEFIKQLRASLTAPAADAPEPSKVVSEPAIGQLAIQRTPTQPAVCKHYTIKVVTDPNQSICATP
jgi:hypothetical protein